MGRDPKSVEISLKVVCQDLAILKILFVFSYILLKRTTLQTVLFMLGSRHIHHSWVESKILRNIDNYSKSRYDLPEKIMKQAAAVRAKLEYVYNMTHII